MGVVMATASSFEAKSRTNSLEGAGDVKLVESFRRSKVVSDAKKEKAVPPPRKSSDPANKSSPVTSPPQIAKVVVVSAPEKHESPKKVSNGSISQGVQLPQNRQAVPDSLSTVPNATEHVAPKEEPVRKSDALAESNGVGDKIRQFERAAEDATAGKISRTGSVRGKPNDKSNMGSSPHVEKVGTDKSQMFSPPVFSKWRREDTTFVATKNVKLEEKESKSSIKFNRFPQDLPAKSPALGTCSFTDREKSVEVTTQQAEVNVCMEHDDPNLTKVKKGYSVSKSGAYYTRGTEEIWMVKKKDIQEIEERVLESFRRAGACQDAPVREFPFSGASTLGRTKRTAYARSESLDPQQAAARAHTLKRQTSVACTCGHDKKARSRSGCPAVTETGASRPRSRSHGEEHSSEHVLDKYETLV